MLFTITFGLILASCGSSSSSGGGGTNTFTLSMTGPTNGQTQVGVAPTIYLVPNSGNQINTATFTQSMVSLVNANTGVAVSTLACGAAASLITCYNTAVGGLAINTLYNVIVNGVQSTSGATSSSQTFSFTTGSIQSLTVVSTSPVSGATNISLTAPITVIFGAALSSAPAGSVQLSAGSSQVSVTTSISSTGILTVTPSASLATNTTYTLTLLSGTGGVASGSLQLPANYTTSFTTGTSSATGQMFAFGTGALSADMLYSSNMSNWSVNMLGSNLSQVMLSGSNLLFLGTTGAVQTTSSFASMNMQSFPISQTAPTIIQYANNGNGTIVGVGGNGTTPGLVMYSLNNGLSWNQVTVSTAANSQLASVAYGNNVFVAVDIAGNSYTSANGIAWGAAVATTVVGPGTSPQIQFANGFFVVAGSTAAATTTAATSPNGTTWTVTGVLNAAAFGATSMTYATINSSNYWIIGLGNGTISYQQVASNAAPTAWTNVASVVGANAIRAIACGNNVCVAGSASNATANQQLAYSSGTGGAPTAWTAVATSPLGTSVNVNSIAFGGTNGTTFVAIGGNGNIAVSATTPSTWVAGVIPSTPVAISGQPLGNNIAAPGSGWNGGISGVSYIGSNTFVAVGNNSVVLTSTNGGANWSYLSSPVSTPMNAMANGTLTINGVLTSVLVQAGNAGAISYSTNNGASWTYATTTNTTNNLNSVACGTISGTGYCVAAGNSGTIIVTTNASTWTNVTSNVGANNLNAIIFANNMFVAVGAAGAITASAAPATSWTNLTTGAIAYTYITYALVNSLPTFVAVGGSGAAVQIAYDITALNGSLGSFVVGNFPAAAQTLNFVSYGNVNNLGQFITVGSGGTIYRSLDGVNWTAGTGGAGALTTVTSSGSVWLATATGGTASTSAYTSSDGLNWTNITLPFAPTAPGVQWATYNPIASIIISPAGGGAFVLATGANGILVYAPSNSLTPWFNYLQFQGLSLNRLFLY